MVPNSGAWTALSTGVHAFVPVSQLTSLADGPHTVSVEGQDAAGNWGTLASGTLVVDRALFANGFETGTLAGSTSYPWNTAAANGRLAVTRTGALAGTWSLQYTAGPGAPSGSVGDKLVAAVPAYTARFTVNPQTLAVSGKGTSVDLFEADDATGATVLRLTYDGTRAVTLCARTAGTPTCTPAQTLPAGATTLTLGVTAGGRATLALGSAAAQQTAAATNAANVLTARLGVMTTAATGRATVSGTALFDAFSSARYALP
jgi:hypothetical protein